MLLVLGRSDGCRVPQDAVQNVPQALHWFLADQMYPLAANNKVALADALALL